jgi:hypothetical protein
MLRFIIGRPEVLPSPLLMEFPELARARFRRGGLPPRLSGWLLGHRTVDAVTLWHTVWLGASTRFDAELLLHEVRHVAQFEASRAFPLLYLWESLRRGYRMNRFEVDARAYAAERLRARAQSP